MSQPLYGYVRRLDHNFGPCKTCPHFCAHSHAQQPAHLSSGRPVRRARLALAPRALRRAGLIGGPMPHGRNHFRPGDSFLELVTFPGCSPVISLGEPGATAEVCHVEVPEPAPASRFGAGENLKPPRCPGCGYRSAEGPAIGAAWEGDPATLWSCPACGKSRPAPALNWRQSAGFGRTFVRLWGIFEARPYRATPCCKRWKRPVAGRGDISTSAGI